MSTNTSAIGSVVNEVVVALDLVKLYNFSCIYHSEYDQISLSKYEMNLRIMV
jgi:hypothetical protein